MTQQNVIYKFIENLTGDVFVKKNDLSICEKSQILGYKMIFMILYYNYNIKKIIIYSSKKVSSFSQIKEAIYL